MKMSNIIFLKTLLKREKVTEANVSKVFFFLINKSKKVDQQLFGILVSGFVHGFTATYKKYIERTL